MTESVRVQRFYKDVSVAPEHGRFSILLDHRPAKTARHKVLSAPNRRFAEAVAEEWRAQGEHIERQSMPLTGMLMAACDADDSDAGIWCEKILSFLGSDLVCYRADAPAALAERQTAVWSPYLEFMSETFGVELATTNGVMAVSQPAKTIARVRASLSEAAKETVFALQLTTAIAGSAVLAMAVWKGAFSAEDAFEASRVDERFQADQWGEDDEAVRREARLRQDFLAAARCLSLL